MKELINFSDQRASKVLNNVHKRCFSHSVIKSLFLLLYFTKLEIRMQKEIRHWKCKEPTRNTEENENMKEMVEMQDAALNYYWQNCR